MESNSKNKPDVGSLKIAPEMKARGRGSGLHVMDVAPTVLNLLGLRVPDDMEGKVIRA